MIGYRIRSRRDGKLNPRPIHLAKRTRTVPVDVLEEYAAWLAVEGAVRPADLEQGTDGPPGTGPAVGTRPRHRRQRQTTRTRSVTPLHSAFVLWSSIKGEANCLAGQPLKIYRRDFSFESRFLSCHLFLPLTLRLCHVARARTRQKPYCMFVESAYPTIRWSFIQWIERTCDSREYIFRVRDSRPCDCENVIVYEHVNKYHIVKN